ncbi:hypothetical protein EV1_007284 [Malus domestica]
MESCGSRESVEVEVNRGWPLGPISSDGSLSSAWSWRARDFRPERAASVSDMSSLAVADGSLTGSIFFDKLGFFRLLVGTPWLRGLSDSSL